MDVNGARFALLLGRADWGRCRFAAAGGWPTLEEAWQAIAAGREDELTEAVALEWTDAASELTLKPAVTRFAPPPSDRSVAPADRRGAAADRHGNVYVVDAGQGGVQVRSAGSGRVSAFWPSPRAQAPQRHGDFGPVAAPTAAPARLGGLAVTGDDHLVVGGVVPAGLQVFDLAAGGPPAVLGWQAATPFVPFDLATRPGGGVWVLDREHQRCWQFDRRFTVCVPDPSPPATVQSDFGPQDASPPGPAPGPAPRKSDAAAALSVAVAADPVAIATLPDNTLLVLDRARPASRVLAWRNGQRVDANDASTRFDLVAQDFVFVPAAQATPERPGRLLVADEQGNQAWAFDVVVDRHGVLRLADSADFHPLRRWSGRALVAGPAGPLYDSAEHWVPLVPQRRARFATTAELVTPVFDAALPQCTWHRLLLDACLPAGTSLRVWTRCAETSDGAQLSGEWQEEPTPYLRATGPEMPWQRPWRDVALDRASGHGSWELLFQRAKGRYLQIKLQLAGNGRATPRLHALRAWFPRLSYAERFLPAVYREEPQSASFVERLLANFEGTLTETEGRIAGVQALFDVRSAPPEALDWLADWFAVALDPAWDERRRRLFLRHTADFFRWRGTVRALKMALHLAFDPQFDEQDLVPGPGSDERLRDIRIVERFLLRRAPAVTFGDNGLEEGLRVVAEGTRWSPQEGNAGLARRWAQSQGRTATALEETTPVPLRLPPLGVKAADWAAFLQGALGFAPETTQVARWQAFLQRRHGRVAALNDAWKTGFAAFSEVPLPEVLPADGAAQRDWHDFQSRVLAILAGAHRFRVLLPSPDIHLGLDEAKRRQDLAARIVKLEKPAHTSFDVGFYWAMFRVDEARLGLDTLLDDGSRARALVPDAVLGRAFVGESFLGGPVPPAEADRVLLAC